ncbi:tetratricopeptide repeat protein [bacterium]|nr:tetratricopeptide repeat protein [bacterium]
MKKIILLFYILLSWISYGEWWNTEWKYRKKVEFKIPQKKLPFEKVGVVDFFANAKKDGSDIRVVDEKGNSVKFYLVGIFSGAKYQICFPLNGETYYIYYGNKNARKENYDWKPEAGLILEVYERKGNKCYNWKVSKEVIEKSKRGRLIGRSFWKKIWDGTNPFGPEKDVVKIYTGYFWINKEGKYYFATSSAGASFIFIDDKMVASWPGWHGARPYITAEQSGSIYLKKGIHKLTYYHIGRRWREISVAAYRYGKEKFKVIPEKFFIPVFKGKILRTEKLNSEIAADFKMEHTNYLKRERWELLTFKFTDTSFSNSPVIYRKWNFGDGQEVTGKEVYHTFISPGFYNITLFVKDKKGRTDKVSMRIKIHQDYSKIYLRPKKHWEYLNEFKKFNLSKLPTPQLMGLAEIFNSYNRFSEAYKCYSELEKRALSLSEKEKVLLIAARIVWRTDKFKEAESYYKKFLAKNNSDEVRLELARLYLDIGKIDEAEKEFRKIMNSKGVNKKIKRKAEIGMGDIYRVKGEREKAEKIYKNLTDQEEYKLKNYAYAQSVIYYLKRKDFLAALEELEKWADEFPVVKIEGKWSVLKAKAHILERKYEKGIKELEVFQKNCKDKNNIYLPVAIYLEGEIYEKIGKKEKSQEIFKKLIKEFPDSHFSKLASSRLQ